MTIMWGNKKKKKKNNTLFITICFLEPIFYLLRFLLIIRVADLVWRFFEKNMKLFWIKLLTLLVQENKSLIFNGIVWCNFRSKTLNKIIFFRKMSKIEYEFFLKKDGKLIWLCEYNRIIEIWPKNEKCVFERKLKIKILSWNFENQGKSLHP